MKNILVFIVSISFSITLSAQKIRFTDTSNVWSLAYSADDSWLGTLPPNLLSYYGSIVIDTQLYYKLGSYIREDTIANIVYIRYYNASTSLVDTIDDTLYNYNWVVGDTIKHHEVGYPSSIAWVISLDSTKINSLWYKVWNFEGNLYGSSSTFAYNVIEGIGCTNRYDWPVNPTTGIEDNKWQLICFTTEGTTPPLSNPILS